MNPAFEHFFFPGQGPGITSIRNFDKSAAPLKLQAFKGDFNFSMRADQGKEVLRISPFRKGDRGNMKIQIGYTLNENGFNINIRPGQEIFFMVSLKRSIRDRNSPLLFIRDIVADDDLNTVSVNRYSWEQYIVAKKIREGARKIEMGIHWQPTEVSQWLEVKDIRVYVK